MSVRKWTALSAVMLCVILRYAHAHGQSQEKPQETTPAKVDSGTKKDAQPTLDELLGLPAQKRHETKTPDATGQEPPENNGAAANKPPVDPTRADLDRRLDEPKVADDFVDAVDLMRRTSERLARAGDAGLETQRLQEETLRKLDRLIEQAKRNKKKQNKQQQSQSQSESQSEQNQQQAQSSQQQQGQQPGQQAGQTAQGGNVPQETARLNPGAAGASASWGDLPPHVREALLQGVSDRFSSTYERLTQEYYKRLAEQRATTTTPSPGDGEGL